MTITTERPVSTWQTHPGWGIAVDLTPREVVTARQLKVHQRLIGLALVLVLALCIAVSLLTRAGTASAQDDYDQEQARTGQLASDAEQYKPITTMQSVTTQLQGDLTIVMAQDVDVVNLLARIRDALPAGLAITTQSVLITPPPAAAPAPVAGDPASGSADGADGADGAAAAPAPTPAAPATPQVIGSVSLSGSGARISDVTPFVAALNGLRGVVDVLPVSVTQSDVGMDFTISLNTTDQLYTERFDPTAGAK